jgi:hypothetical protein
MIGFACSRVFLFVCVLVPHGGRNYFSVWQMALVVGCDVYILSFWIFIWRLPLMGQTTSAHRLFGTSKQWRLFLFPSTTFVVNPPLRCWTTNAVDKISLTGWETEYSDYQLANMQPGVWVWVWSRANEQTLAHGLLRHRKQKQKRKYRTWARTNPLLQATSARQMFNSAPVWHLSVLHVCECVSASRRACQLFFSPGPQGK